MPRKNLVRTAEHPYHLRARSNNKDWFDLPLEECFEVFEKVVPQVCERYEIHLHAFVLMSNHWHMLATTPKQNIDQAMFYLMSQSSRGLREKARDRIRIGLKRPIFSAGVDLPTKKIIELN